MPHHYLPQNLRSQRTLPKKSGAGLQRAHPEGRPCPKGLAAYLPDHLTPHKVVRNLSAKTNCVNIKGFDFFKICDMIMVPWYWRALVARRSVFNPGSIRRVVTVLASQFAGSKVARYR